MARSRGEGGGVHASGRDRPGNLLRRRRCHGGCNSKEPADTANAGQSCPLLLNNCQPPSNTQSAVLPFITACLLPHSTKVTSAGGGDKKEASPAVPLVCVGLSQSTLLAPLQPAMRLCPAPADHWRQHHHDSTGRYLQTDTDVSSSRQPVGR